MNNTGTLDQTRFDVTPLCRLCHRKEHFPLITVREQTQKGNLK